MIDLREQVRSAEHTRGPQLLPNLVFLLSLLSTRDLLQEFARSWDRLPEALLSLVH